MSWRILVVDDEPRYCDLVCRVAEKDGFSVKATTLGHEAAALLQAGQVDLLVTDLDMPDLSGFDLVELAGKLSRPPEILLITAQKHLVADFSQCMLAIHCLLKPFELSDLRAKLALLTNFHAWNLSARPGAA